MTGTVDDSLEPLEALGRVAVIAPHPDDESLGCGGLIARMAAIGKPPVVIVVSDGTGSHPNSPSYPPERLRTLREEETRAAVAALGSPLAPVFLRLRDTAVPHPNDPAFAKAVERVASALPPGGVDTIAVSFRDDPHCDHQAAFALAAAVAARAGRPVRLLEYVIWNDDAAATTPAGFRPWRLDIAPVLAAKLRAIGCHRSQTTGLIADDPGGFRLKPCHAPAVRADMGNLPGGHSMKPTLPGSYFDDIYRRDPDPWRFATSPYEAAKYQDTLNALPDIRYDSAFEIGCSIGVLTRQLAARCMSLLSVDISPLALAQAAELNADLPHVRFTRMEFPAEAPEGLFDLILMSEVGYYLSMPDLDRAILKCRDLLRAGGDLLLVHYIRETDYPLTGHQVHERLLTSPDFKAVTDRSTDDYRLTLLRKAG